MPYLFLLWSQIGAFADPAGVTEGGECEWFSQRPLDPRVCLLFLVLSSILTRNRQTGVLCSSAGRRGSELKSHYKNTAEAAGSLTDDRSEQPSQAAKMLLAVTWASAVALGRLLVSVQPGSSIQEPVTFISLRLLTSPALLLLHDWRSQPLRDTSETSDPGSAERGRDRNDSSEGGSRAVRMVDPGSLPAGRRQAVVASEPFWCQLCLSIPCAPFSPRGSWLLFLARLSLLVFLMSWVPQSCFNIVNGFFSKSPFHHALQRL